MVSKLKTLQKQHSQNLNCPKPKHL